MGEESRFPSGPRPFCTVLSSSVSALWGQTEGPMGWSLLVTLLCLVLASASLPGCVDEFQQEGPSHGPTKIGRRSLLPAPLFYEFPLCVCCTLAIILNHSCPCSLMSLGQGELTTCDIRCPLELNLHAVIRAPTPQTSACIPVSECHLQSSCRRHAGLASPSL